MLRSTRTKAQKVTSNILPSYGHITIPRHLRDIVITEYGIADLRGKTDKDIIAELLKITDSRFQDELIHRAKRSGKFPRDYKLPDEFRDNLPQRLDSQLGPHKKLGYFPTFPLGTDFTEEELVLGKTLKALKARMGSPGSAMRAMVRVIEVKGVPEAAKPYLARMGLDNPGTLQEKMSQKLIISELTAQGHI
jgi:hypothetical protein